MKFLLLILLINLYLKSNCAQLDEHDLVIQLKNGGVRGEEMIGENGNLFYAFRGIPFAEPPVGELRFKAPVKLSPWKGILNATKDGPHCSQMNYRTMEYRGSEDCLYLNVYTPKIKLFYNESNLDVIFHIHGGGFVTGDGGTYYYGPKRLLLKDVILVSATYRVGPFGFLSTGDSSSPGNYGLLDQLEALHWVKNNIHNFGGDATKVTILGESAGGASVIYHMLSPLSTGLFHRAIAMSGSSLCPWALQRNPFHWAKSLGEDLNCSTNDSEELINCLRHVSAVDLTIKGSPVLRDLFYLSFTPTVDGYFIRDYPINIIKNRKHNTKIPLLIGVTKDEGNCKLLKRNSVEPFSEEEIFDILKTTVDFRPNVNDIVNRIKDKYFNGIANSTKMSTEKILSKALTDGMFHTCIFHTVKLMTESGNKVYFYSYDFEAPFSVSQLYGKKEKYGVCHMDDLFMLFDGIIFGRASFTDEITIRMKHVFQKLMLNFVKTGNPVNEDDTRIFCEWPPCQSHAIFLYHIDNRCSLELYDETSDNLYQFWIKELGEKIPKSTRSSDQDIVFTPNSSLFKLFTKAFKYLIA